MERRTSWVFKNFRLRWDCIGICRKNMRACDWTWIFTAKIWIVCQFAFWRTQQRWQWTRNCGIGRWRPDSMISLWLWVKCCRGRRIRSLLHFLRQSRHPKTPNSIKKLRTTSLNVKLARLFLHLCPPIILDFVVCSSRQMLCNLWPPGI